MKANNYDMSSTGVNIELKLERDVDLACILFNENFRHIEGNCRALLHHGGDSAGKPWQVSRCYDWSGADEKTLRRWCVNRELGRGFELRSIFKDKRERCETWIEYTKELLDTDGFEWYVATRKHFPAIPGAVCRWSVMLVRGYSSGDWCCVMYEPGTVPADCVREYFRNLLYNRPIYLEFRANRFEYYWSDTGLDGYDYYKGILIGRLCELVQGDGGSEREAIAVKVFLEENLPEDI